MGQRTKKWCSPIDPERFRSRQWTYYNGLPCANIWAVMVSGYCSSVLGGTGNVYIDAMGIVIIRKTADAATGRIN